MAVQVETQGQLQEFLGLLRRRKWQVLLPAAAVVALGVFFAVVVPKKFVVRTQVELRPVGVSISPKEAANAPFQLKSLSRITKVLQALQNREYLALPPDEQVEFEESVQKNLRVTTVQNTSQGTSFVNAEYSDVQREWAADFLRALREDWIEDVVERDRRKAQDELSKLREARSRLEKQWSREEERLTELLRGHGLSATQPIPGSDAARSEDPVFKRLEGNQADLAKAEAEIATLGVRAEALQARLAALPPRIDKEEKLVGGVSNEDELSKVELAILEAQRLLEGIRPQNSRYKKTQETIRSLESRREQLTRLTTKGELQRTTQANPEVTPLRLKLDDLQTDIKVAEAQRARLASEIETDRARVSELQDVYRDVREGKERSARYAAALGAAEVAYQAKAREVDQLLSPLANPFEITQEVAIPPKPTEPNPWLILSFGLVAGLALGIGLALLFEYSRNCFRSVADIGRVLVVPVLGSVAPIVTRREARLFAARRIAVGASSLVFVGAILFVTWAWANDAQLLAQDLRDAIEGLRSNLK